MPIETQHSMDDEGIVKERLHPKKKGVREKEDNRPTDAAPTK